MKKFVEKVLVEWTPHWFVFKILKFIFKNLQNSNSKFKNQLISLGQTIELLEHFVIGRDILNSHNHFKILGKRKKITFIITHFNKKDELTNSVASLIDSANRILEEKDYDIIVIDDGSPESPINLIEQSNVLYIKILPKNLYGISKCRNLGAQLAQSDWLTFIDPDFLFATDYVDNTLKEINKYDLNTIISGYIQDYDYIGAPDPRTAFGIWEKPNRRCKRFIHIAGGHLTISTDKFFEVGGYDEDLIYGGVEDAILGFEIGERFSSNTDVVYSSNIVVKHIPHQTSSAHLNISMSTAIATFRNPNFFVSTHINEIR